MVILAPRSCLQTLVFFFSCALQIDALRKNFTPAQKGAVQNATSLLSLEADSSSAVGVAAGVTLRGRYELHSLMYRREYMYPSVGSDFPTHNNFDVMVPKKAAINKYQKGRRNPNEAKHLGTGSFGDVWKAYDLGRKEWVAVKIFYKDQEYLTMRLASAMDCDDELYYAVEECQVVIDIMKEKDKDPEGASRICQCYEEHISDAGEDDPLFLVMEMCGDPLDDVFDTESHAKDDPPIFARQVMKEVLEGIRFLSKLELPRVHHDLKLENVVIDEAGHAKLIDWGAVLPFEDGQDGGICTPQYVPPEVLCVDGPSFNFPGRAYEFDVFSTGLMFWELICNDRPGWDDDELAPGGYKIVNPVPENRRCPNKDRMIAKPEDLEIVRGLMEPRPAKRLSPRQGIDMLSKLLPRNASSKAACPSCAGKTNTFMFRPSELSCSKKKEHSCKMESYASNHICVWKDGMCRLRGKANDRGARKKGGRVRGQYHRRRENRKKNGGSGRGDQKEKRRGRGGRRSGKDSQRGSDKKRGSGVRHDRGRKRRSQKNKLAEIAEVEVTEAEDVQDVDTVAGATEEPDMDWSVTSSNPALFGLANTIG